MTTGMKNMGLSSYKERIGGEVHQEALLIYYYMSPFIIMPRNKKKTLRAEIAARRVCMVFKDKSVALMPSRYRP